MDGYAWRAEVVVFEVSDTLPLIGIPKQQVSQLYLLIGVMDHETSGWSSSNELCRLQT